MLKPALTLGVVVTSVLTFGVFQIEQRVQSMQEELQLVSQQLLEERETIHVLKAEWSLVTKPERLRAMLTPASDMQVAGVSQVTVAEAIPFPASENGIPALAQSERSDTYLEVAYADLSRGDDQ